MKWIRAVGIQVAVATPTPVDTVYGFVLLFQLDELQLQPAAFFQSSIPLHLLAPINENNFLTGKTS